MFTTRLFGVLIATVLVCCLSQAQDRPYLFSASHPTPKYGHLLAEVEVGYGVRAARPFGEDGLEQRTGITFGLSDMVSVFATAGMLIDRETKFQGGLFQGEVRARLLEADSQWVNLSLGAGYIREYLGANVLFGRIVVARDFSRFNISANTVFEKAFVEGRDAIDVITSLGFSYGISENFRPAVEVLGEDLEGFFDPTEAEGGARLLVGPTLHFLAFDKAVQITVGGGAIFYLTQNAPTNVIQTKPAYNKNGFSVRCSLVYGF
jgi:hypothetical protein